MKMKYVLFILIVLSINCSHSQCSSKAICKAEKALKLISENKKKQFINMMNPKLFSSNVSFEKDFEVMKEIIKKYSLPKLNRYNILSDELSHIRFVRVYFIKKGMINEKYNNPYIDLLLSENEKNIIDYIFEPNINADDEIRKKLEEYLKKKGN